jgi:hypothetical protein
MIPLSLILKTAKWPLVKKLKTDKTEKISNIYINKCLKKQHKKSKKKNELFLLSCKR